MKMTKLTKAMILSGFFVASAPSYAWFCSEVIYNTTINSIYSSFQTTTAGLGNLQKSIDFVENSINTRLDLMDEFMQQQIDAQTENHKRAIKAAEHKIIDALKRMGNEQRLADTAIAAYEVEKDTNEHLRQAANDLSQPVTNCIQYGTGANIFNGLSRSKRVASDSAMQTSKSVINNEDSAETLNNRYKSIAETFIETNDPELKNADVNAALVFGSVTGEMTRQSVKEDKAADAFKSHIVGEHFAPEQLKDQNRSPQGQIYSQLLRRYATYAGLTDNSISSVMENHRANPELLEFFKSAGLTPTPQQQQNGVSTSEVINIYADKLVSGTVLNTLANAPSNSVLLRQLNQNMAARNLVNLQKMKINERKIALKAAELAVIAEKVLGEQAKTLRQDVVNNGGSLFEESSKTDKSNKKSGSFTVDNVFDGTTGEKSSITIDK